LKLFLLKLIETSYHKLQFKMHIEFVLDLKAKTNQENYLVYLIYPQQVPSNCLKVYNSINIEYILFQCLLTFN
jgi:hypothetical protein